MKNNAMRKESNKSSTRRDFIKKAGKFAVYTPPALVLMTKPGSDVFGASLRGKANLEGCSVPGVAKGNPNCDGLKEFPGGGPSGPNINSLIKGPKK